MPNVCHKTDIGSVSGIPEFKVEWEGHPIPHPILYTKTSRLVVYAEICGPDDLLNDAWNDIVQCAAVAGAAAGITAIVGSPAAALPAFKAAFITCMDAKIGIRVSEINVALSTEQQASGGWHRV
jgi:hypothetical protein